MSINHKPPPALHHIGTHHTHLLSQQVSSGHNICQLGQAHLVHRVVIHIVERLEVQPRGGEHQSPGVRGQRVHLLHCASTVISYQLESWRVHMYGDRYVLVNTYIFIILFGSGRDHTKASRPDADP